MRARIPAARLVTSVLGAAFLVGCGSLGAPLPPVYPNFPAIASLDVAQRGSFAILRFPAPALQVTVGSEEVELEDVEVLVYAERYPVLTAEILIAGLERRAEVMRLDAIAEAEAEQARAAREAVVEQAAAEGREPPPPDPDAPPTTARRRNPDEDAMYRVPRDVLEDWRRQGLAADAIVAAAQRLAGAVDTLWRELGLPATVIDPSEPVLLPDPGTIAAESAELVERTSYDRPLDVDGFLGRASVSRTVPVEQFEELLVGDLLQVAIPVGTPATGRLRTRYFFAVRASSTRDTPGLVTTVAPLAPAAVPVAPANIEVSVGAGGVELSWEPPGGDLALRRLAPDDVAYNVYRLAPDGIAGPTPINPTPLVEPSFTDSSMQWGETYVYEVRALLAGADTPLRESQGARTDEVQAVDVYPPTPPADVNPQRAGSRVTLQWTPSRTIDIVGYRVYRHPLPAPEPPLRLDPDAEEGDPAASAPPARQEPEGENQLVAAGWELLTPDAVPFSRFTDADADPSVRYVYAVEAIDAAGNLSALALATEPGDDDR